MGLPRALFLSSFIKPSGFSRTATVTSTASTYDISDPQSPTDTTHDKGDFAGDDSQSVNSKARGDGREDTHFKPKHRYMPILSGLVCPFSVLLDIPGLTERWYIKTEGYNVIETQPNPKLLDVALAISIFFGLAANIALITRFLEKRVYQSTWIAIIGLTIHDIINVVTVIIFGVIHRFNDGFTYGTAYWMCVASTVCSLVCNTTLVIDLVRTPDFRKNGSGLTSKQRSLVIAVMFLLCYIGLGSLVFSFIINDTTTGSNLTYINSLYFTICTISSVGFGDIYPVHNSARIFSFFYDIAGLVLLAFTIAIARETVIETFEASYRHRREILATKARVRKEEKRRRAKERQERLEKEMQGDPDMFLARTMTMATVATAQSGGRGGAGGMKLANEAAYERERAAGVSEGKAWINKWMRRAGLRKTYLPTKPKPTGLELERSLTGSSLNGEEAYAFFKKEVQKEQAKEFQLKIGIALALFWSFWLIGSAVFHATESWTYFEAMWFCFVFFTTIGYGDFSPKSSAGRAFFVAWSLMGIATMTLLLSVVTETWSSRYHDTITESTIKRKIRRIGGGTDNMQKKVTDLLGVEGYSLEDSVDTKDFPTKLVDAVKGFHEHARYFMLGRTGDIPAQLRPLLDAADDFNDELQQLKENSSMAETGANTETRHFLFMVSYERTFDALTEAAENLSQTFKTHTREIEEMQRLNEELRTSIEAANRSRRKHDHLLREAQGERSSILPFASARPLGGEGDDEYEAALIAELDDNSDEERAKATEARLRREAKALAAIKASVADAPSAEGIDVLRKTSQAIHRMSISTPSRIAIVRHDSSSDVTRAQPQSVSPPMPGTSSLGIDFGDRSMTRQSTLVFAEPEKMGRTRSDSLRKVGEPRSPKMRKEALASSQGT